MLLMNHSSIRGPAIPVSLLVARASGMASGWQLSPSDETMEVTRAAGRAHEAPPRRVA